MCTVGAAGATSTYQNRSSAHQAAMNHLRYGCLVEHWNQVRSSEALGETRFQPRQTTHFHLLNSFGTVMADQSITMKTGATVTGRLLARIGAVTLESNTITKPAL